MKIFKKYALKKWLLVLVSVSCSDTIVSAQEIFVTGSLRFDAPVGMVYLSYPRGYDWIIDSAQLQQGQFRFAPNIAEPTLADLTVRFDPDQNGSIRRTERIRIFVEPGNVKVHAKDSLSFAEVTGSKAHKAFKALQVLEKPYNEKINALNIQYWKYADKSDTSGKAKVEAERDKFLFERKTMYHKYLTENPESPIALYVLDLFAGNIFNPDVIEPMFLQLPESVRNTPSGINFKGRIEASKKTAVGAMAMDFTQDDTLGNPVSLSDFRGKYVLIDFWASWCGPCRAENPNIVKVFEKYRGNGFTVLGVSLDRTGYRREWVKAIRKDGLAWTHVSDLKGWYNEVAVLYGIRSIPQNLLIDPGGRIIAKNLEGGELDHKLSEIMGK